MVDRGLMWMIPFLITLDGNIDLVHGTFYALF